MLRRKTEQDIPAGTLCQQRKRLGQISYIGKDIGSKIKIVSLLAGLEKIDDIAGIQLVINFLRLGQSYHLFRKIYPVQDIDHIMKGLAAETGSTTKIKPMAICFSPVDALVQ